MNFLSHYYFDKQNNNPYEVLGAILPDLIKNANKSWNIHPEKKSHFFVQNDNHQAILKGWRKHVLVDKLFHSSTFFLHHQHQIKLLIRDAIADSPVKPFFLGHISLELLLDSFLLSENLIDANRFYNLLNQVDDNDLQTFLKLNDISDTERFFHVFNIFKREKYLFSYTNPEKITYALKMICKRLWENPFTQQQETNITKSLNIYKTKLSKEFLHIFELIDTHVN